MKNGQPKNRQRGLVATVEVFYLLVLFALALIYLIPEWRTALHIDITSLGPLPLGVPWFGALGAVILSLTGVVDHRDDWDDSWNIWHFTRPLIGISLAIVSWVIFKAGILAVGPAAQNAALSPTTSTGTSTGVTEPSDLLYYLIAFVVGYREDVFRELIKRVADVILTPGGGAPLPVIKAIDPTSGKVAGGDKVTITGSGFTGTTSVKFGSSPASSFQLDSDTQIAATTPPGAAGSVSVTVSTPAGSVTGGKFTYE